MKFNINLNKANDFINKGLYNDAIKLCDEEINLDPNNSVAWIIKGIANLKMENYESSITCNNKALELNSNLQVAWLNKAVAHKKSWQLKESISAYKKAIKINPKLNTMWINLARVYETMGNYTESEKCYEYILKNIDSNDFLAKFNLSLLWLKKGNFKNGLKNFEFRFDNPLYWKRRFTKWPLLKNLKIIKDKKVLVWMEGGLGDTILFCRYVEKLLELGAHVTYEVPPSLINIIKTLNSKIKYVSSKNNELDDFDFQIPLMSLPLLFETNLKNIPNKTPYLKADKKLDDYWKLELKKYSQPKIGLVWSSSSSGTLSKFRSMDIKNLQPIITKQYNYFSLQNSISDNDQIFLKKNNIVDFGSQNLDNIFAIVNNLDLVISIDTLFAQIAGSLNIPIWVLVNLDSDWKWLLGRKDSPWHSSMKVYSQQKSNDWTDVIKTIQKELTYFSK
tara:strand:- start:2320 stop:3663 length:1344 start_codon:yes stop_codon:yes gene_type:complete